MQLKLSRFGPPMWFLGDPKNITISLNFQRPGPVEVDFASLSPDEQKKILVGVQAGHLECDVPFPELYHQWSVGTPVAPPSAEVDQVREIKKRLHDMRMQLEADRQTKKTKEDEHCAYLLGSSVRAIKTAITGMKDANLVRRLLVAEKVGKKRKGVITALAKKQRQLAVELEIQTAKKVAQAAKTQLKGKVPEETIKYDVIESEQETVVLTPDDLIAAAAEESIGGE